MVETREELIRQREALDKQLAELDKDKVRFSVDAGIIDRLGRELMAKQETAVSELVKNAYDADANEVILQFVNTDAVGGTLIIEDDGHGMDLEALRKGFMRLSSTDKVHNPVSPKYGRKRAGRKGIGRFATQRLGSRLTIITQTEESETALKVIIEWDDYQIDRDINLVANLVEEIPKQNMQGTTLIIDNLRENWTTAEIQRVFRYVSDLLQPSYLSDRLKKSEVVFASQEDNSFSVNCQRKINEEVETISDIDKSFFEKALAVFEGFVDMSGEGFCSVTSKSLGIDSLNNLISISAGKSRDKVELYNLIKDVHFKAYYFIYNRPDYYEGQGIGISSIELKRVNDFAQTSSGVRLYRNGFRVPPFGDVGDDWLDIDERVSMQSHARRIPMTNKNLFGFVEITDEKGHLFEETSSREGLIKNEAFGELVDFLIKAFDACRARVESSIGFTEKKKKREKRQKAKRDQIEQLKGIKDFIDSTEDGQSNTTDGEEKGERFSREEAKAALEELEIVLDEQMDEIAMLRVLAGMGLSIGEFVHEIRQFSPAFEGDLLTMLAAYAANDEMKQGLTRLSRNFEQFQSYAAYFDETIRNNAKRELRPIEIRDVVRGFEDIIRRNALKNNIKIESNFIGYDLYTCPMHASEWSSILFNFYSNSKKAIIKADVSGKILIVGSEDEDKIVLEFSDNGIGIPPENSERVFDAFFTTSTPAGRGVSQNEELLGSGLGLKIISDIIESYGGEIFVSKPPEGYKTCIRIELPEATEEQIEKEQYV
ncbi:MAG TPA: ATP-binding protein [Saprospiraceae bacterium]|nr:ATP-binding protein [Saprospiraceae bacterium]HMQ81600.1 ATP-binding protein [Saprospiraceae bacterium]